MKSDDRPGGTVPFYIPGSAGRLFCLYFPPASEPCKRAVLYFPPFAEEMNKARRMAVLQTRQLVDLGYAVLLIDLFGTGDSEGDFSDARWSIWRDDLTRAANWLVEQGAERLVFWGLRLGATLAVELMSTSRWSVERLVLWQPVVRGEAFMTQFLRLRIAAELAGKQEKLTTQKLRDDLKRGLPLEIAGYKLSPDLCGALDGLDIEKIPSARLPAVDWIEVVAASERPISAVGARVLENWRAGGVNTSAYAVAGDPFWSTPEITIAPALLEKTSEVVAKGAT